MSWLRRVLPKAQPWDLLFLGYVAFSGILILAFGWKLGRPVLYVGLVALHLALLALGTWFARRPLSDRTWFGALRDVYPIVFVAVLYWELRYLALLFSDGYRDPIVLRLEEALFGEQLAMTFSQRFPMIWLSEIFHFFYAIYWALLPLAAAGLYFRRRVAGFRELVYVSLAIFFVCYVVFIYFPVQGPHYQFPLISGHLAEGPMYGFVHWVLEDGGSKGAAFPSSHVAVAVGVLLVAWRHDRLVFAGMFPLVVGLTVGTVYGRFHYGVDALSGILLALVVTPLALYVKPRMIWGPVGGETRATARDSRPSNKRVVEIDSVEERVD